MITLADRIREAREAPQRRMGMMAAGVEASADGPPDPLAVLPPEIAERIAPARGPVDPTNPSARCDFCPRVQSADMMVEVEPDRYACDSCMARRAGGASDG